MSDVPDEVREGMSSILEDDAIEAWWHLPIPALDERTPQQTWSEEPERVRQLIDAYESGAYL